jgi:signal transduction histidine kinase
LNRLKGVLLWANPKSYHSHNGFSDGSQKQETLSQDFSSKDLSTTLPLTVRWIDLRKISIMRVTLALSALLVVYVDPSDSHRFLSITYFLLAGYVVYSVAIWLMAVRHSRTFPIRTLHWLDVAWYLPLIALSNGTNSIFFSYFFFAILVASFGWGFGSGMRVTIVSAVLFIVVGYTVAYAQPNFQLNRFFLRPIQLLVLGYLISYWGGVQGRLIARLQLLKEVSLLSNPRFGVDRTIQSVLESLRAAYSVESCLTILPKSQAGAPIRMYGSSSEGDYNLHITDRTTPVGGNSARELTSEMARVFLSAAPSHAIIYRQGNPSELLLYDTRTKALVKGQSANSLFLNVFEGKSCFSVPIYYRAQPVGRLYLVGGTHLFDYADVDFVLQVMEQITGVLENIRLVDSLASDAAGEERRKIAQDIHDSVIQPYIGLQFGLTAVKQKLAHREDVRDDVEELLSLTNGEIADLRNYVGGLRRGETPREIFLPAVRRFASKFSEATGLHVQIEGSDDLPIYDRLAAELFQMIEEALSNVRRHSTSSYAKVHIAINDGQLEMRIRNERLKRLGEASFTPRSIVDRAAALGGRTVVYTDANLDTVVCVQIPL